MVVLLRKVDSVQCNEQGRWTGRRSSPMEQTSQPKLVPVKRWGTKKVNKESQLAISMQHSTLSGFSFYFNLAR